MKKKILVAILLVVALIAALSACTASSDSKYVGIWQAEALADSSGEYEISDESGLWLQLEKDGTGTIILKDTSRQMHVTYFAWERSGKGIQITTQGGYIYQAVYEKGSLFMIDPKQQMIIMFDKIEIEDTVTKTGGAVKTASA